MTQHPGSSFHEDLGRRRYNAAGAWEQRWKHNGGKVMQTTFTVGGDVDTKWVSFCEDGDYQRRLNVLFDHLADAYWRSAALPDALLFDYLIIN